MKTSSGPVARFVACLVSTSFAALRYKNLCTIQAKRTGMALPLKTRVFIATVAAIE